MAAESYWKRIGFDVGVADVSGVATAYCSGMWDGKFNVEHSPKTYAKPGTADVGNVRIEIRYQWQTRQAVGLVEGKVACQRAIDLPPVVSTVLELGGNLHKHDSSLEYALGGATYEPR